MYSLAFQNLAPQPWNLRHWSTWISTLPLRKRWEKRLICMANPTLGRAELHSLHERNRTVCTIPRTRAPQTPLASQTVQVTSNSCAYWKTYLLKHQRFPLAQKRNFSPQDVEQSHSENTTLLLYQLSSWRFLRFFLFWKGKLAWIFTQQLSFKITLKNVYLTSCIHSCFKKRLGNCTQHVTT